MKTLRVAGLTADAVGAAGSLALTLYVGLRSGAPVLVPLFAIWVLSPFGVLWLGHIASRRWPAVTRATLYATMLIVSAGSLAAYTSRVLAPPKSQGAFVFVIVPPLSSLLAAVAVSAAATAARVQKSPRKDHVTPR